MTNTNDIDPIHSSLVEDDPSFADLVVEFVSGLDTRLATLTQAADAQDLDAVRSIAHQLKGSGGGHGYPQITDVAAGLECNARDDQLQECLQAIAELTSVIQRVQAGAPLVE